MKLNNQTIFVIVAIVAVAIFFTSDLNLPQLSIMEGSPNYAGLDVWNSDVPQSHTLTAPASAFEMNITWVNEPGIYYVYPSYGQWYRATFKLSGLNPNQWITLDCNYNADYWELFDGVGISQHMSDDFKYSSQYGGRNVRGPSSEGSPKTFETIIRYSSNHLIISVNEMLLVDNFNLKDFMLSSIVLSNPYYNTVDVWGDVVTWDWAVCNVYWTFNRIPAGTPDEFPTYATREYIEWAIPELSWSNKKENYLSEIAVSHDWEWKARITNWKATFQFNDFTPLDIYTDRAYIWIHHTTSDDYLEICLYDWGDHWTIEIYDALGRKTFDLEYTLLNGISNMNLEFEHINGRLRITVDGKELSDTKDIIGSLGDFSLADISWDGDWGNWGGSTDIKVELLTEAPLTPSFDFPWWILILVVAVIVVYYAFGGGKK